MLSNNYVLPYKLGFIAATAALLIGSADADIPYVPSKTYRISAKPEAKQSWEDMTASTYSTFHGVGSDILEQTDILIEFAFNIIDNSENLRPEIINMINKKFWDLLT